MKVFVVVSLLCVICQAQLPKPCESPKQFEGRITTIDKKENFVMFAKLSYDADNRRVRQVEEMDIGSSKDFYDNLYLYNEGFVYSLNLKTKKCNKTVLTRPFIPMHLPSDAKFRGEESIGEASNPNEHMIFAFFEGKFENNFYGAAVTVPSCFPVQYFFISDKTGLLHTTFFDITAGISDPSVFIPPQECPA